VADAAIRPIVGNADGTPNLNGYAVGARIDVDEVARQGAFIQDLMKIGNLEDAKGHAEAIVNLSRGGPGQDLDGDKSILAPSDGYGLRNYVNGGIEAARAAKNAQDATNAIRLHADHTIISGQNALAFLDTLEKQCLALIAAQTYADARAPAQSVQELAVSLREGVDKDNNGTVDPVPGEGAIFSMYDHAQYIAAMAIVSGAGGQTTDTSTPQATESNGGQTHEAGTTVTPEVAKPATNEAAQAVESGKVTIKMLDFEYDKPDITVKVGTEVTFIGAGSGPDHSATADDNSFDTGLLGVGESKTVRFDKPGKFAYYCALHGGPGGDGMAGTITVVP
jgi:plastocyanin